MNIFNTIFLYHLNLHSLDGISDYLEVINKDVSTLTLHGKYYDLSDNNVSILKIR